MSFKQQLSTLMHKIPGAVGVILADWEGEAVDQASHMDDFQLQVIGAHQGVILSNLRQALHRLEQDDLKEIVITTEKLQTLVLPVTDDYFLVLLLERRHSLGRALFEARQCLEDLKKEIA